MGRRRRVKGLGGAKVNHALTLTNTHHSQNMAWWPIESIETLNNVYSNKFQPASAQFQQSLSVNTVLILFTPCSKNIIPYVLNLYIKVVIIILFEVLAAKHCKQVE